MKWENQTSDLEVNSTNFILNKIGSFWLSNMLFRSPTSKWKVPHKEIIDIIYDNDKDVWRYNQTNYEPNQNFNIIGTKIETKHK